MTNFINEKKVIRIKIVKENLKDNYKMALFLDKRHFVLVNQP